MTDILGYTMSQPTKRHKPEPGPFYKILRKDLTHRGFTYQLGLNVDTAAFEPTRRGFGGIYFSDLEHIAEFFEYGDLVARVTLPPNAQWIQEGPEKFKADRIVLSDFQPWKDWDLWNDASFAQRAVQWRGLYLEHARHQTPELCLAAVQGNGLALQYVRDQTPELCMAAVQRTGYALCYVIHQTPELCLEAVQEDCQALRCVKHQTPEICWAAVQHDGHALQYVKHQTPELCLAAVQQNGNALQYVKHQTPELCLAAVQQTGAALQYVNDRTPELLALCRSTYVSLY